MATTLPSVPTLSQRGDIECWKEAIKMYNDGLKNGSANKKYIELSGPPTTNKINSDQLMFTALDSYSRLNRKRSRGAEILIQIWHGIHHYGKAIDVFIQFDPKVASLVWGSVRVLLQITEEEEKASRIAGEGIMEIIYHVGRWEQAVAITDILSSPTTRQAIVRLYHKVVDFLVSSTNWLRKGSLKRFGISILAQKASKFEDKLKEMRAASELVDKEIQTRATLKSLDNFGIINLDVRSAMQNIDQVMDRVRQLSDTTSQLGNQLSSNSRILIDEVLKELRLLPIVTANKILDQMRDVVTVTEIRKWLALAAIDLPPVVSRADGTCDWLFSNSAFQKLMAENQENILWVQGLPGRGKSVLAGYLQGQLVSQSNRTSLFIRFQRSASTTLSTPTMAAALLIYQLLDDSAVTSGVAQATNAMSVAATNKRLKELGTLVKQFPLGPRSCSFEAIWPVAEGLMRAQQPGFNLVMDALDECTFDGPSLPAASTFLQYLSSVVRNTESKIIIFCRPDPPFALTSGEALSIKLTDQLLLHDIMIYAEKEYDRLGLPKSERDKVLEHIRLSSSGSFWWAELFLDYLGRALQMEEFQRRLDTSSLVPSITNFYRSALNDPSRPLEDDERQCRNSIFLISFQTQRPLKVSEVADALSLRQDSAEETISRLCKPLVSVQGGLFQLAHPSVRDFLDHLSKANDISLGISLGDAHSLLAEKCISALLREKRVTLDSIASFLEVNYDQAKQVPDTAQPEKGSFYDYASRFWHHHLCRIHSPSPKLLGLVCSFLDSLQFVYWAEYSRHKLSHLMGVTGPLERLKAWQSQLQERERNAMINVHQCVALSYNKLAAAYEVPRGQDTLAQWLSRMSLCDYYLNVGLAEEEAATREEVARKVHELLGPKHPVVLLSKSSIAWTRLCNGKMRAAYKIYTEVAEGRREVVGEDDAGFVEALHYQGMALYYMGDFAAALVMFTKTAAEMLRLRGSDNWSYHGAKVCHGLGLAQLGKANLSLPIIRSVFEERLQLPGSPDEITVATQASMADVQRELGYHHEAITNFQKALEIRRGSYPASNVLRMDIEIKLARTYQEAGMLQEAEDMMGEIEEGGGLQNHFERYCQVAHIKAKMALARGLVDEAIVMLQQTVVEAEQDQGNRALMWIRLDLATMLRQRNSEGDVEQASSNFDSVLKDVSGESEPGFPDEPDSPRLLALAEKALKLVRENKYAEVHQLLESEQVDWARPSDLWLWVTETVFV
ncbi:hypothetical protein QBC32DRAFT_352879 [Pseudoneurospora amorphoporcata]|uniref:NACHT domain-containing protein n=1 Tax=Pseudoneurospora amorphoporcata TaxID=241081 RepID=A0AAN6NN43_9PEZI|nr:hypothetical protein QBC32DRAFT_352879 [Pseudoneurospora amorphoporcata]